MIRHGHAEAWRPDLHVRLARRFEFDSRITRAAIAALIASLFGWIVGLDMGWHALALLASAALAAALPVRPPERLALGWIAREAGLAYQTHMEHAGRPDPFGLLAAGAVQARLTVRGVAPPPRSPWWLPMAAAAVGVWIVASVVGGPFSFPGAGSPAPGAGPNAAPPPVSSPPPPPEKPDAPDEVEAPDAVDDEAEPPPPPPGGRDTGGGDDGAGGDPSEGESVERFLDNLRERATATDGAATADGGETGRDDVREAAAQPPAPSPQEEALPEGALQPSPGEPVEEGEGEEEVMLPPRGTGEEDDGEEGEETAADAEGEDGAGEGAADDEAAPEPDGEMPSPDAGGEQPEGGGEPGPSATEPDIDAGDGDGAGRGIGTPAEDDATELTPQGEEERLPGMLLPGPETPGGRVRLPGRDEAHVPEGTSLERFERAVEQAVTDGAVPVPYQEVIRNYFR
jgi:hypothetical protein